MLDTVEQQWFAVQVWAGREQLSARHLQGHGYDVFLPCSREARRWSDRVRIVNRALFTGYLFCRLNLELAAKIITAPGVIRIVGGREGLVPIPAVEVEAIQRIVETQLAAEPWNVPEAGKRVRVELGPLRGIEGVVLVVKNRHRLVVSIPLLQRAVSVEIESDWVNVV